MIIRSQDKRIITTDMNLYIEPIDNKAIGNVACWIKNNEMGALGTYSSYEKAIKVLDMIQEAYCKEKVNDVISSGLGEILGNCKEDIGKKFIEECRSQHCFQMPQDCEV